MDKLIKILRKKGYYVNKCAKIKLKLSLKEKTGPIAFAHIVNMATKCEWSLMMAKYIFIAPLMC